MLEVQCNATIGALPIDAAFTATKSWTALFGPSGSGKSSLLRLVAGLWRPQKSRIVFEGIDLAATPTYKRRVALVSQQPLLFPHMDARRNVTFAIPDQAANAAGIADDLLRRFRVPHAATRMPRELSGGEIQRVAIARALAMQPRLLLLDEVFPGMGAVLAADLRNELRAWQRETGVPIVSVTHDIAEALEAEEVIRLHKGRTGAQGPPRTILSDEREATMLALSRHGI